MTLPSDPDDLLAFYMYRASASTLLSIYDAITEIQTFELDNVWPVDSKEYQSAADVLEALKIMIVIKQNKMVAKSQELLE